MTKFTKVVQIGSHCVSAPYWYDWRSSNCHECMQVRRKLAKDFPNNVAAAFAFLDAEGNGWIATSDLCRLLQPLVPSLAQDEVCANASQFCHW